jgi:hypothetical protein
VYFLIMSGLHIDHDGMSLPISGIVDPCGLAAVISAWRRIDSRGSRRGLRAAVRNSAGAREPGPGLGIKRQRPERDFDCLRASRGQVGLNRHGRIGARVYKPPAGTDLPQVGDEIPVPVKEKLVVLVGDFPAPSSTVFGTPKRPRIYWGFGGRK